jgi:ATP-dependent Clp protease protease subunit
MKKLLNEIMASHTGQDFERVKADTDRDNIMTPQQAMEYGIIDEVIGSSAAADVGG